MNKYDYRSKVDDAVILKFNPNEDEIEPIKVKEISQATPINGLDLFRFCAFNGAMIQNADKVKPEKTYYLEFLGMCTYRALYEG
jgi:hypothetical protein